MLLLLLLGAGQNAPVVNGVRAYATISFRVVDQSDLSFRLLTNSTLTLE